MNSAKNRMPPSITRGQKAWFETPLACDILRETLQGEQEIPMNGGMEKKKIKGRLRKKSMTKSVSDDFCNEDRHLAQR